MRKTFISQNITLGLMMSQFNTRSNLLQQDVFQQFNIFSTQINPEIKWQYKDVLSFQYEGKWQRNAQQWNGQSTANALWQVQHTLKLGYIPSERYNISLYGDYYRNEVTAHQYASALFLNAEIRYVSKRKWELSLMAKNISAQKKFESQIFSLNQSSVKNYQLRPTNILLAGYYKF